MPYLPICEKILMFDVYVELEAGAHGVIPFVTSLCESKHFRTAAMFFFLLAFCMLCLLAWAG
jgi:hypothetical protein